MGDSLLVRHSRKHPLGLGSLGVGRTVQAAVCQSPASLPRPVSVELAAVQHDFVLVAAVAERIAAAVGVLATQIA